MKKINNSLLLGGTVVVGIVISFILSAQNNVNGMVRYRSCVESTGGYVDPRTGDGPDCLKYGMVTREESKLRTALRGIPEGAVGGFIVGILLVYARDEIIERVNKRQ